MLKRIDLLIENKTDFAIETTLSSKNHLKTIIKAKEQGYAITLLFFWLNDVELAKVRVKSRVEKGGHHIPEDVIERRYKRGLQNLEKYRRLCDYWYVYDSSNSYIMPIAEFDNHSETIFDKDLWNQLKN